MARWSMWVQCLGLLCAGGASAACGGRTLGDSNAETGAESGVSSGAAVVELALAHKCVQELTDPDTDSSCIPCVAQGECCTGKVGCEGEPAALSCDEPLSTQCFATAPTASIAGTSPDGPLSLSYAWKRRTPGAAGSRTLFFTQASMAATCDGTSLSVTLAPPFAGQRIAAAVAFPTVRFAVAYVTFDHDDIAHTSGTIDISDDGWDVHGKFDAPDCPLLDTAGN